jgi:lipopolysaccharide transport system permease protein
MIAVPVDVSPRLDHSFLPPRWIQGRDLLRELVARDIALRYRGSLLGVFWTLLNPLAELLVLTFIFVRVLTVNIPNFPAYLFIGLTVYGWFQTSLTFATMAVVGNRELVRRPGVPPLILPVVTVASNLVHFLLSLPIVVGLLVLSDVPLTGAVLALPALIAIQFALILGFSYPLAIINVWFRDTTHVLRVALQLLFFLTPIFYEASALTRGPKWLYYINPMAQMIDAYRAILLHGALPGLSSALYLGVVSTVLLLAGMAWFHHASHRFADEV